MHNEENEIQDYFIDPYAMYEKFDSDVELIIDGGFGKLEASTIIDCTGLEPNIVRQGGGEIEL